MKVLIGVDGGEAGYNAAVLSDRLRFRGAAYELMSVVEPPVALYSSEIPPTPEAMEIVMASREAQARTALAEAARRLEADGIAAASAVRNGFAANQLLLHADASGADLVALGGEPRSMVGRALLGSVCRKLLIGAQESLLIAKTAPIPPGELRAVFATDHSAYAERCATLLSELAPAGLAEVTVMTAYPSGLPAAMRQMLPNLAGELDPLVERGLAERNELVVRQLSGLPCRLRTRVVAGDVHAAIERTMRETGSTLLILGAQGHGFIERVRAGSTSMAEALSGRYHVLVLRPRMPARPPRRA